jgi:hypothetical protein
MAPPCDSVCACVCVCTSLGVAHAQVEDGAAVPLLRRPLVPRHRQGRILDDALPDASYDIYREYIYYKHALTHARTHANAETGGRGGRESVPPAPCRRRSTVRAGTAPWRRPAPRRAGTTRRRGGGPGRPPAPCPGTPRRCTAPSARPAARRARRPRRRPSPTPPRPAPRCGTRPPAHTSQSSKAFVWPKSAISAYDERMTMNSRRTRTGKDRQSGFVSTA